MVNKKDEAIDFFKEKILEIYKPKKILRIGSNRRVKDQNSDYNNDSDFDIIIIMDDEVDCYECSKLISTILKATIVRFDILISAYPIKESVYLEGESEFLNNVRKNSIEIEI